MDSQIFHSQSEKETFEIGFSMGKTCRPGDVILLEGDLGVGKTVFSKGFGNGLGIKEPISSPTFTIIQIYDSGRLPLYHFDIYRITDVEEMYEIGYEDYFYGDGVCLIEWASVIQEILPEKSTLVQIEKDLNQGFEYRKITVTRKGS